MMPLSYQSIGFTSIVLMVACLIISEIFRHAKARFRKSSRQ